MVGMLRTPYFAVISSLLGGELVHNGGYHAAGTAPFGPEVDDDGQL